MSIINDFGGFLAKYLEPKKHKTYKIDSPSTLTLSHPLKFNQLVDGPQEVDQKDTLQLKTIEFYNGKASFTFEAKTSESSSSREFSTKYINHGLYRTYYMVATKEPGESLKELGLSPAINPNEYKFFA